MPWLRVRGGDQVGCHASRSMHPKSLPKHARRQAALSEPRGTGHAGL